MRLNPKVCSSCKYYRLNEFTTLNDGMIYEWYCGAILYSVAEWNSGKAKLVPQKCSRYLEQVVLGQVNNETLT